MTNYLKRQHFRKDHLNIPPSRVYPNQLLNYETFSRLVNINAIARHTLSYLPGQSAKQKLNRIGNRLRCFSRHCDERDM